MTLYQNILETVGNTPVIKINRLTTKNINLYVKFEAFNPLGSVKDRLALGIIEEAERSGELKPGQTVIEATSGNTGIGLAMVCAQKGYPLVIVMAETFSVERRKLMRFLGAKVVLTPATGKGTGMVEKAKELAEKNGWFLARQFENTANPDMHAKTTAIEILRDFEGQNLDYWVTGYGSGGTLAGVSRVLQKESPQTKIIVCEPDTAEMLGSGTTQERNDDKSPKTSHPSWTPHIIQGWAPDFIPNIVEEPLENKVIDQVIPANGPEAVHWSSELAKKEGIFTGISGGATFATAMKIAEKAEEGASILCMLPDTGERYLSTPLFADVEEKMTEEEKAISSSTPSFQL